MSGLSFDTGHADMIHDAQMDYYGKRLATASSDRTVKIWDQVSDKPTQIAELKGHEGGVWQVAWAHPKFGSLIASCSYDRRVIVWRENNGEWVKAYEYNQHDYSVNSIAWAPHEFGLVLACGSSDGNVTILSSERDEWTATKFVAHSVGVNAVSWSLSYAPPSAALSSAAPSSQPPVFRLATGGSDCAVKIWRVSPQKKAELETTLDAHKAWVRDVAWASNIGLPYYTLASCDQDGVVAIWTQDEPNSAWKCQQLPNFNGVVWRVSWSITGNILAVSSGDNKVSLWKQSLERDGEWKVLSQLDEDGSLAQARVSS